MKRFKLTAFAVLFALTPALQSCLDGETPEYPWLAVSSIRTIEGTERGYYFQLDDDSKLYPSDTTNLHNYPVVNRQRAFVRYDYLDGVKAGYDRTIKVGYIIDILTKDIVELTAENAAKIGDDKINVTYQWIAQGYLNLEFQYFGTRNPEKKHFLNLVENSPGEKGGKEGYISLEFRHNAEGDVPSYIGDGYVSFKLDKIADRMVGAKGLRIRVNTIYDGEKFLEIDFKEDQSKPHKAAEGAAETSRVIY